MTKRSTIGRVGREAGEVEAEAAGEGAAVGLRRGREAGGFEPGEDEGVDWVFAPDCVLHLRRLRSSGRDQRPMRLVLGAFGDPLLERFFLGGGELLVGFRRRHHRVGIGRVGARDERALGRLAGDDGIVLDGDFAFVEAEVGLAGGAVGAVAGEAVLREDRADVAVVLELVGGGERRSGQ